MITASLDGTLKFNFWHFHHAQCQHVVLLADVAVGAGTARRIGVSHVIYHPDNELVAVACDDLVVRLLFFVLSIYLNLLLYSHLHLRGTLQKICAST